MEQLGGVLGNWEADGVKFFRRRRKKQEAAGGESKEDYVFVKKRVKKRKREGEGVKRFKGEKGGGVKRFRSSRGKGEIAGKGRVKSNYLGLFGTSIFGEILESELFGGGVVIGESENEGGVWDVQKRGGEVVNSPSIVGVRDIHKVALSSPLKCRGEGG